MVAVGVFTPLIMILTAVQEVFPPVYEDSTPESERTSPPEALGPNAVRSLPQRHWPVSGGGHEVLENWVHETHRWGQGECKFISILLLFVGVSLMKWCLRYNIFHEILLPEFTKVCGTALMWKIIVCCIWNVPTISRIINFQSQVCMPYVWPRDICFNGIILKKNLNKLIDVLFWLNW